MGYRQAFLQGTPLQVTFLTFTAPKERVVWEPKRAPLGPGPNFGSSFESLNPVSFLP